MLPMADADDIRKSDVYMMVLMIFEATCSPCHAQYIKNENAKRFTEKYSKAVEAKEESEV